MYFPRGLLIFVKFFSAGGCKLGPALLGWPDAALYLPSWELWEQAAIIFLRHWERLQKTQLHWELVQIKFTGCLDPNTDGKL